MPCSWVFYAREGDGKDNGTSAWRHVCPKMDSDALFEADMSPFYLEDNGEWTYGDWEGALKIVACAVCGERLEPKPEWMEPYIGEAFAAER